MLVGAMGVTGIVLIRAGYKFIGWLLVVVAGAVIVNDKINAAQAEKMR